MDKYYRIEVEPRNIGPTLETPYSLNPTRVGVAYRTDVWESLNNIIEFAIQRDLILFDVCQAVIRQYPMMLDFLPGIWEVLMERTRPKDIPCRRTECAFFFKNRRDAENYKCTYPGMQMGRLCEVTLTEPKYIKELDMNWVDKIDEKTAKACDIVTSFEKYWDGQMTENPIIEVIYNGKYQLNPIQ